MESMFVVLPVTCSEYSDNTAVLDAHVAPFPRNQKGTLCLLLLLLPFNCELIYGE